MDKWLVAVAAGAGSIVQHFKKSKQDGPAGDLITSEALVRGSFSNKPDYPKQPFDKKCPFRRLSSGASLKQDDSGGEGSRGVCSGAVASASGLDGEDESGVKLGSYEGGDGNRGNVERVCFRSRKMRRRVVRPLSSLERCVMVHVEMEGYMPGLFGSSSRQTVRPFFVTDGSNVINRENGDSYVVQNGSVVKKRRAYIDEKNNSLDATLLVGIGMSFGMLYSFVGNKREVEKLNRLLNQKENLVRDLEDEIEMKDSLILRELTVDDHKSQRTDGGSLDGVTPHSVSRELDSKESVTIKENDNSFSKIEAELEAELEMLELSMTKSNLDRKISNLDELDPDFEPDVAEGELRAKMLDNTDEEDERGSTTSSHSANYAVSPRELSIRLHEVLQSRLEERIRELEAQVEVQNHKSWKYILSSTAGDENHEVHDDEPVVLNLSGEALEAYNEACNEFAKFDESDEEFVDNGTPGNSGTAGEEMDFEDADDDEMEKMLIKHIVEKARQGSPAVLNAQKALFSMNLNKTWKVKKMSQFC